jgi:hypothetical protein
VARGKLILCGVTLVLCTLAGSIDASEISNVGNITATAAKSVLSLRTVGNMNAHRENIRQVDLSLNDLTNVAADLIKTSPNSTSEIVDYSSDLAWNLAWDDYSQTFESHCQRISKSHRKIMRQVKINASRCSDIQPVIQRADDVTSKGTLLCAALRDGRKHSIRDLRKMVTSSYSAIDSLAGELYFCKEAVGSRSRGSYRESTVR